MIIPSEINSMDYFLRPHYKVLLAGSYFGIDPWHEIRWHKKHIKKLKQQKKKPLLFHRQRGHSRIDEQKIRHHKEWVLDSIPFHQKFIYEHEKKIETILRYMDKKTYKRLIRISLSHGGLPEYFVVDKKTGEYVFVALHSEHKRNYWIHLVKEYHKICDVIVFNN